MNSTSCVLAPIQTKMDELIAEKNALVGQLNVIQEQYNQNEFNEEIISKMMQLKEKIAKITKKINVLKFKDKER